MESDTIWYQYVPYHPVKSDLSGRDLDVADILNSKTRIYQPPQSSFVPCTITPKAAESVHGYKQFDEEPILKSGRSLQHIINDIRSLSTVQVTSSAQSHPLEARLSGLPRYCQFLHGEKANGKATHLS